jgi:hypothetical protein
MRHASFFVYQKKFGLIKRNITPIAPRIANPMITFLIIFFPVVTFSGEAHQVAIMTPHIMIKINETIKIAVINIFIRAVIRIGKALHSSIVPPCVVFSIQLPIKGILVLSLMPQQTSSSVQGLHTRSAFSHCPSGQLQEKGLMVPFTHHVGGEQGVQAAFGQQYNQSPHIF